MLASDASSSRRALHTKHRGRSWLLYVVLLLGFPARRCGGCVVDALSGKTYMALQELHREGSVAGARAGGFDVLGLTKTRKVLARGLEVAASEL